MSRLDEIRARLEGRSNGAHVAYESEFGCGGYLLKEPGDEEFFAWAGDDMLALLAVVEAHHRVCLEKAALVEENRRLRNALKSLRETEHYQCEDGWYSCPKSASYFGDSYEGTPIADRDCWCGLEGQNAKIDAALKQTEGLCRNST